MALTAFILVVCLVYQVALRKIWNPTGLQMIVDELLHTIVPVFMYVYWLMFQARNLVMWQELRSWLLFPVLYLVWVLLRGYYSGFYPYPFLNMDQLGTGTLVLNISMVLALMLLIMTALYFATR